MEKVTCKNGYSWILRGKKVGRQISLLILTLFIGKFVYHVGLEGMDVGYCWFSQLQASLYRVHENLMQNPRNNISIVVSDI